MRRRLWLLIQMIQYRLDDDSEHPEIVRARRDSAGMLYAGDRYFLRCMHIIPRG